MSEFVNSSINHDSSQGVEFELLLKILLVSELNAQVELTFQYSAHELIKCWSELKLVCKVDLTSCVEH
jgi:hypothetical protein